MTALESYVVSKHPDTDPEVAQSIVKATIDETFHLALEQALKYRRQGELQKWGALRRFSSKVFGLKLD